jgi:hypothetical protein
MTIGHGDHAPKGEEHVVLLHETIMVTHRRRCGSRGPSPQLTVGRTRVPPSSRLIQHRTPFPTRRSAALPSAAAAPLLQAILFALPDRRRRCSDPAPWSSRARSGTKQRHRSAPPRPRAAKLCRRPPRQLVQKKRRRRQHGAQPPPKPRVPTPNGQRRQGRSPGDGRS